MNFEETMDRDEPSSLSEEPRYGDDTMASITGREEAEKADKPTRKGRKLVRSNGKSVISEEKLNWGDSDYVLLDTVNGTFELVRDGDDARLRVVWSKGTLKMARMTEIKLSITSSEDGHGM